MSGYWKTCGWLDDEIRKLLYHFPVVLPTSSVLGRVSFLGFETQRTHPSLHSPLVRGYVVEAKPPRDSLDGTGALLKCLLKLDSGAYTRAYKPWLRPDGLDMPLVRHRSRLLQPEVSCNHLERSGRPKSSRMKLGWRSPL